MRINVPESEAALADLQVTAHHHTVNTSDVIDSFSGDLFVDPPAARHCRAQGRLTAPSRMGAFDRILFLIHDGLAAAV